MDFAHTPNLVMESIYYADDDQVEVIGDKGIIFVNRGGAGSEGRIAGVQSRRAA